MAANPHEAHPGIKIPVHSCASAERLADAHELRTLERCMALWVERERGIEGESFIAERVLHFGQNGDTGGK